MLSKKEKTIVGVLIGVMVIINIGLLVWYLFVSRTTPEDPVNPPANDSASAEVFIEDNRNGTATVYLELSKPTTLVGAELYFKNSRSIVVTDIVCETGFTCLDPNMEDTIVAVIGLRPPSEDFGPLSGRVALARILYDTSTSGTLVMNTTGITKSIASSTDTNANLISPDEQTYTIGSTN